MNERLCFGIFLYCKIKVAEYEMVVVAFSYGVGNYVFSSKVHDGTEVEFLSVAVGHFCNIGEPFFVWLFCCECSCQNVFCCLFFFVVVVGWLFSADDGLQACNLCQTMEAFLIVLGVMCFIVFIHDSAIAICLVVFFVDDGHFQ